MSEPLVVTVPHSLGKAEALRRLKSGFARVTANIPVSDVRRAILDRRPHDISSTCYGPIYFRHY